MFGKVLITPTKPFIVKPRLLVMCETLFPINSLSANPTKWSNTRKQFVGNLLTNRLSVFDHFVGLALKGLKNMRISL